MPGNKLNVPTAIKDEQLIAVRRRQIVQAGVQLFKEKGFHRTTTREIAKLAGFSIGTLYEYIRTKEDVLYLVCDSIFDEVMTKLESFPENATTMASLNEAIRQYFLLIDSMFAEFTIMYQETKSLPKEAMHYVLDKELEMVAVFEKILRSCLQAEGLQLHEQEIYLAANQIVIQGQAWAFRKWALQKRYTIDQYIEMQTRLFLQGILHVQQ